MNDNECRPKRLLIQDKRRLDDVNAKHDRVREMLNAAATEALLLQHPANIAWFSAGADLYRCAGEDCSTSLFVTPEARLFATNSVDSSQIFEREAFGLGFQLKQREWYQPHQELVADLCRGRRVISDGGYGDARVDRPVIGDLRLPLTQLEVERMRMLSRVAVHAVEATAHNLRVGVTESEVAGEVSHRLLKRTVAARQIHVCADGRNERYRHWTFSEQPIQNYAVISCIARRWGLHVGVTRTACLGSIPQPLLAAYRKAALIHATALYFSRAGRTLGEIWSKVHRIYEKFGMGSEWQLSDQASVIGYSPAEVRLTPGSDFQVQSPVPLFWHPSVGPAMFGDTVLCQQTSNEQLTLSSSWPRMSVRVKGQQVNCPGLLLIRRSQDLPARSSHEAEDSSAQVLNCPAHPQEDAPSQVESVWEMRVPPDESVWPSAPRRPHESVME